MDARQNKTGDLQLSPDARRRLWSVRIGDSGTLFEGSLLPCD